MAELFVTFLKIGLFTFGGGYAMIALIEDICVEKKQWITHEELVNITVIAESTPGPIAINCATFVGCKQKGFAGAVAATVGVVVPSFVILYLISLFFDSFLQIPLIAGAFRGVKIGVGLLILNAGWNMLNKMKKTPMKLGILVCAMAAMLIAGLLSRKVSTIVLLLAAAVVSLIRIPKQEGNGG